MSRRGTCMEHETDFGGTYTFLFSQNPSDPGSCYHCVKIYTRTVNIIEKQESKIFQTFPFLNACLFTMKSRPIKLK